MHPPIDVSTFALFVAYLHNFYLLIRLFSLYNKSKELLPNEIKESTSVSAFKFQLNKNLPKPPKYFNVGSRLGQVLQARLRMECSTLNADLYRKDIVNSPSCQCGSFENAQHLFFTCPLNAE